MGRDIFEPLYERIEALLSGHKPVVLAIDGRCGSGKTTLAAALQERFGGNLFHTDDFYLPFERRSPDWERVATRNMDFNRLREEVLIPATRGERITYGAYDPHRRRLRAIACAPEELSILEGSYSHHPILRGEEDLRVFLTCDKEVQAERLKEREGEHYADFVRRWIPLEEQYFREYAIRDRSDLVFDTGPHEWQDMDDTSDVAEEETVAQTIPVKRPLTRREELDRSVAFFSRSSFWNGGRKHEK